MQKAYAKTLKLCYKLKTTEMDYNKPERFLRGTWWNYLVDHSKRSITGCSNIAVNLASHPETIVKYVHMKFRGTFNCTSNLEAQTLNYFLGTSQG